ncbi:transcriptional regulator CynR [Streptomyces cavernicola]|uniref:Transcriptional regulator CynR n=1 Tax=Streptomyces cavernicola TaxID=3043613 RepID=A0ABT6SC88_9ACTN|nr:transcriptional regulator CynR [Streptomyces sp. B-S-A6]MDI3405262.1 transcriptional regulator CynR [Streptomyces sp. B-S-A6]
MGPELRHLRYLIAVAEQGNFTRAAEELRISQPTLSQQIKQLERVVGAQLLDRSGRSVRLTDAGEAYVHYARRALRDLAAADRAVLDVADLARGHLRLAMTPTFTAYLTGPLVQELHARHPGISLEVREMTQDRIEASLSADEIDLGIAFEGPHLAGVTADPLFTETLSLVVTAHGRPGGRKGEEGAHAAADGPLSVADLAEQQLALLSNDFVTRGHVDAYFAAHRISPPIAVEANSIQAITEIVQRTPTLATVLPDAITDDHPHLTPIALDPPLPTRGVTLLRRDSAYQSAAARAFTKLAHRLVQERGYAPA